MNHALGNEANVRGVDVLLGTPNVNIHRDPLNGRLFEGYSEDPCLVSKLAPSFVKGIQDEGVAADVKHFAANNQETDRMGVNEHIPERALREIYLPGFQACVQAGCKTVMSAYNKINGAACAQNRHLLHGKMILVQGTVDPQVTAKGTVQYYEALKKRYGQEKLDSFLKFYVIPGYGHGTSGKYLASADFIRALEQWDSSGKEPKHLHAVDISKDTPGRGMQLSCYPQQSELLRQS